MLYLGSGVHLMQMNCWCLRDHKCTRWPRVVVDYPDHHLQDHHPCHFQLRNDMHAIHVAKFSEFCVIFIMGQANYSLSVPRQMGHGYILGFVFKCVIVLCSAQLYIRMSTIYTSTIISS